MHYIEDTRLPQLLAQHAIIVLNDPNQGPPSAARPAIAHWAAGPSPTSSAESAHDFLVLGLLPEWRPHASSQDRADRKSA